MNYKDCPPIKTVNCTAWLVEFSNEKRIDIWNTKATIKNVIEYTKTWNKGRKFRVSRIDTGSFKLDEVLEDYANDNRKMDQNFDVQL